MKTKIIITIALLTMIINFGMGNNASTFNFHNPVEMKVISVSDLAPVTPREATFEDYMIVYDMKGKLTGLQITTPKEALFNDYVPEPVVINISKLAPVTPDEAPFDDEMKCGLAFCNDMLKNLAPAAPKEADFNNCSITTGNDNLSVVPDKVTGN